MIKFEYILFGGCIVAGRIFIPEAVAVDVCGVLNNAIILSLLITLFVFVKALLSFEDENACCKSSSKFVIITLLSFLFVDDVVNISCKGSILSVEEAFVELDILFEEADGKGNDGSSKKYININF
jgi:hypothetical protein